MYKLLYNLLIDAGNSDVKIGKCNSGKCISGKSISGSTLNVELLKRYSYSKSNFENEFIKNFKDGIFVKKKSVFNKIGISLLESTNRDFLNEFFINKYGIEPEFIDRKSVKSIKITYKKRKMLKKL